MNINQHQLSPESELYLQQLESAILHAATTGSPESSHLLDVERCKSSDGLAGACLELLRRRGWGSADASNQDGSAVAIAVAQHDAVAFYALTTIQRSPLLSCLPPSSDSTATFGSQMADFVTLRNQLRSLLLATMSHVPNLHSMPQFVVTKIAVLLALLVREDYPTVWTYPLRDVLGALKLSYPIPSNDVSIATPDKMVCMDMYISFLDAISDEIVYPAAGDGIVEGMTSTAQNNHQRERMRREQVKDALRGFPINNINGGGQSINNVPLEPCVPLENTDTAHIVGWLLNTIITIEAQASAANENLLALAVRAAATLKRYLSWVDIRLSTNPNLVQMLLDGLGGASSCSTSDEEEPTQNTLLAVECANCLGEIVDRGMDEERKLALLKELDIFGTLCHLSQLQVSNVAPNGRCKGGKLDLSSIDGTQVEAVAAAAELINTSGLALIQGWELDPTSQHTNVQMEQCLLELVLACLAYDSIDVSGAVVDLVSRILVSLEKKENYWNDAFSALGNIAGGTNGETACNKILSRILIILHLRMKYEEDFNYDYEDEEEAEEELYRTQLRKLFQRIVRLNPQIVLQFIQTILASLRQPLSSVSTPDIEVALRLLYHYGEGRRPAPGTKTALKDGPFRDMVVALHRSDVASHPHREVLLLYYDISVRYGAILKDAPELLSLLLGSLSGNRGLQHPHPRVRCRCCYLLLRVVKLVGAKAMRPHVEVIVEGIQTLLFPPAQTAEMLSIPPDEALYLFETTGILLGTTGLDNDVQVRCATAVLTPHIRSIEQALQNPDLASDVETFGEQLSLSISAIAQLSKGWQKHPPPEVQTVLAAAVDVCRNILVALPSSPPIRNRSAVLLQRMILCLGEGILPMMPSFFAPLLAHCSSEEDVLDISQLINQLCIKYKEKACASVDAAILPFLQKVVAIQLSSSSTDGSGGSNNGSTDNISPPPHLITEQLSIRKQAFATLQHIAVHSVSAILYSETNVASLGDILQLMNDGATTIRDPVMNKTCIQFFCELINQWGCCGTANQPQTPGPSPAQEVSNAFFDFVYNVFVPGMICRILDNTFNVKDALHSRVLAEFGRTLWSLKQSPEFQSRVVQMLVLGRGASPSIANGFVNATCGKEIELTLKAWKEELKRLQ